MNNNSNLNLEHRKTEFLSRFGKNSPLQINIKEELDLFIKQFVSFLYHHFISLDPEITQTMFPEVAKYHQQYSYRSIWNCDTTKDIISQFLHHIEEPILFFYIEQLFNLKALKYSHMELPIFLNQGIKRSFIAILEVRSLNIDCLFTNDGEIRFYPKGDSVLDKILVEDVIPLTTNNSEKLYKDALTSYFKKDFNIAADNLRKCLES